MQATPEEIKHCAQLKITVRASYGTIGSVDCPVLGHRVHFNSIGLHHFSYKADGTPRDTHAVIYKLTRFPLAIPVIKNAIGIEAVRDIMIHVGRGNKSKWKKAKAHALVAKVGKKNPVDIRVIVARFENGQDYFYYSVMND